MHDLIAALPNSVLRNVRGCESEFILYMLCLKCAKLGRFAVAFLVVKHSKEDVDAFVDAHGKSAILGGGGSVPGGGGGGGDGSPESSGVLGLVLGGDTSETSDMA